MNRRKGGSVAVSEAATTGSRQRAPAQSSRKRKAPTLGDTDWEKEPMKTYIKQLYMNENCSLRDLQKIVANKFDFHATERQFLTRLEKWGLKKKTKSSEAVFMVRKQKHRRTHESHKPDYIFRLRGQVQSHDKLERLEARITPRQKREACSPGPVPETPSEMSYWTGPGSPRSPAVTTISHQSPLPTFLSLPTAQLAAVIPQAAHVDAAASAGGSPTSLSIDIERAFALLATGPDISFDGPSQEEIAAALERRVQNLWYDISVSEYNYGPNNPIMLSRMRELVWALCDQNKFESAEEVARHRVLASGYPSFNMNMPQALCDLSELLRCRGNISEAEKTAAEVYKALPKLHPWWQVSVQLLAVISIQKGGHHRIAEDFLRELPEIQSVASGFIKPFRESRAMDLMTIALAFQGRLKDAEIWMNTAADAIPKDPGLIVRSTPPLSEYSLANVLLAQARWDEAKAACVRGLSLCKKTHGPEHREVPLCMSLAGEILSSQGRWEEAEACHIASVGILKRCQGPSHVLFDALFFSFQMYAEQRRWDRAEAMLEECRLIEHLSESRSMLLRAMKAELLNARGSYHEAINIGLEVQEYLEQKEPRYVSRLNRVLAGALRSTNKHYELEELEARTFNMNVQRYGPNHPETLRCMDGLARTAMAKGESYKALHMMRECVRRFESRLGLEHYLTLASAAALREWEGL